MSAASPLRIELPGGGSVSALLQMPQAPIACFVMAHGAGAGMAHAFMTQAADGLEDRRIATLRYQFPYMEQHSKRPDRPPVAQATVRAAVERAAGLTSLPLFAGGKSFGARMTSQAQAVAPLPGVRGLAFLGFPLHPADAPAMTRAEHLSNVTVPMLFIQGERDRLATPALIAQVVDGLDAAMLASIPHADHGFEVLVRSGRTGQGVIAEVLDTLAAWITTLSTIHLLPAAGSRSPRSG